jgi:hypothetical protein
MMLFRLWRIVASAILAAQMGGAMAADMIKLAVPGPTGGPYALQGEERLKIFQADADIVNALDPALTESKCDFWRFRFEVHSETQVNVLPDCII